jgi:hypothetical protein
LSDSIRIGVYYAMEAVYAGLFTTGVSLNRFEIPCVVNRTTTTDVVWARRVRRRSVSGCPGLDGVVWARPNDHDQLRRVGTSCAQTVVSGCQGLVVVVIVRNPLCYAVEKEGSTGVLSPQSTPLQASAGSTTYILPCLSTCGRAGIGAWSYVCARGRK